MTRLTALVVDDHAEIRKMIAKILLDGGFDVIGQAADAAQALDTAARLIPDVITLDISMPGMSGLEVLPRLRAELPGAIIAMLTMNKQYVEQARRAGADLYILKGRAFSDLIPAIRGACEQAAPLFDRAATSQRLAGLQARVESARRRYDECRREAKGASDLTVELHTAATISSDGAFAAARAARLQKTAGVALREYLGALRDLQRLRDDKTPSES